MANLNAWQKITRVLSGKPFGDGADGAYSSATIPTMKYKTCSGTATSTTLTADTDASPFAVGDILLLHQTRGTGVGQWEINRVSAVGSDEYTLQEALHYTYTDSGASQAQAVVIPRYTSVTVESGTWTLVDWDGDVKGILTFAANGTTTVTGTISGNADGYRGGAIGAADQDGYQGEGGAGVGTQTQAANTGGGGGGDDGAGAKTGAGGGGGGYGATGTNGVNGASSTGGTGGTTDGSADLIDFVLGGGGGGGGNDGAYLGGAGGDGGGGIFIFSKDLIVTGGATTTGANGSNASSSGGGGGGGSGGAILMEVETATLGTNKLTAVAGSGGTSATAGAGGAGAVGRIAVHHSGAVIGTTSPTFTDVEDSSLVEAAAGGAFLFNLI